MDPIHPPHRKLKELERWLELSDGSSRHPILDFLGFSETSDSTAIIRKWLIGGDSVIGWPDALLLARAHRHAIAHGALSATKVNKWGLRKALQQINETIGTVANAIMERLAED
jgi:hypothetical protein